MYSWFGKTMITLKQVILVNLIRTDAAKRKGTCELKLLPEHLKPVELIIKKANVKKSTNIQKRYGILLLQIFRKKPLIYFKMITDRERE